MMHVSGKRLLCPTSLIAAFMLLSLEGCFNSSVTNATQAADNGSTSGVSGISPWDIELSWTKLPGTDLYRIYSVDNEDEHVAQTPFTKVEVPVEPGRDFLLKVYSVNSAGKRATNPIRTFGFTPWDDFSKAPLKIITAEKKGIQVSWTYEPWSKLPMAAVAKANTKVKCYFLQGSASTLSPFSAGAITVEKDVAEGTLYPGALIQPSTAYRVGCEMVYADGKTSRNDVVMTVFSSATLVDDPDAPFLTVNPVQVSRAISFLASKVADGTLDINIESIVPADGTSAGRVLTLSKSGLSTGANEFSLDSMFPNIPGSVYGGQYRLGGSFISSAGENKIVASKDFYVKSADDPEQVLYPEIRNISAAQSMGSALATGDFDCDGLDDLAVGLESVAWLDPSTKTVRKTGVVIIYYGTYSGSGGLYYDGVAPSTTPGVPVNGLRPPVVLTPDLTNTSRYPYWSTDAQAQVRFGHSLAVGNFNRDFLSRLPNDPIGGRQCMDLAIGAPGEDTVPTGSIPGNPTVPSAGGSVYIAYGGQVGIKNTGWSTVSRPFTRTQGSCLVGAPPAADAANHPSGVSTTDYTFQNYFYPQGSCTGTKIYPFDPTRSTNPACYGSGGLAGCTVTSPYAYDNPLFRTLESYPFLTNDNGWYGSQFGTALNTGDLDNDGFDDLIIGAPNADSRFTPRADTTSSQSYALFTDTGAAFVYFGSVGGIYTRYRDPAKATGVANDKQGSSFEAVAGSPGYSPIKIHFDLGRRGSSQYLGSAVGIAQLGLGNSSDILNPLNEPAFAFVGAPGFDSSRGVVGAIRHWPDPTNRPSVIPIGGSIDAGGYQAHPDLLWGEATGDRFGSAIATGNFRDPRGGNPSPPGSGTVSIGLQMDSRMPFRQGVAIGAPSAYSGQGRVYIWSADSFDLAGSLFPAGTNPENNLYKNRSGISTSLYSTRVGNTLCDSATSCPGGIIEKPGSITGGFGEVLATIRAPNQTVLCTSSTSCTAGAGSATPSFSNKWQPIANTDYIDSLLVGSPTSGNSLGSACLYKGDFTRGITNICKALSTSKVTVGDRFGASLAGGYFASGAFAQVAVGAPMQSFFGADINARTELIRNGGSVFLFKSSASDVDQDSLIDLALETPYPNSDFLSLSVVEDSGFSKSRYVGDLNCDGYGDVAIPHFKSTGNTTKTDLLIVYGSPDGLVLKRSDGSSAIPQRKDLRYDLELGSRAPQWINTDTWGLTDPDPLRYFAGVGSVNGDKCDDLFVADNDSIVIYGSDTGLVLAAPSDLPTGKNPKKVLFPNIASKFATADGSKWQAVTTAFNSIDNPPNPPGPAQDAGAKPAVGAWGTLPLLQPNLSRWNSWNTDMPGALAPICHGDFNGDGFGDVALGSATEMIVDRNWQPSDRLLDPATNQTFTLDGGRWTPVNAQVFVYYGGDSGLQTSAYSGYPDIPGGSYTTSPFESNCADPVAVGVPASCRPAILFDPAQFVTDYEPFRMWRESNYRNGNDPDPNVSNKFLPIRDRFGELCVSVGDLDKDGYDDLVVPLPRSTTRKSHFVLFRGSKKGLRNSGIQGGDSKLAAMVKVVMKDTGNVTAGQEQTPPVETSTTQLDAGQLGWSSAGLGDINGDGYADFALGAPALVGSVAAGGAASHGGVAMIYGRNQIFTEAGTFGSNVTFMRTLTYPLCDRPGLICEGVNGKEGHLIRPDRFDSANQGIRFGEYVDAAGDVNGDGFGELMVNVPKFSPPGLTRTGASILYFGRSYLEGDLDVGWNVPVTANNYVIASPTLSANCDANLHCKPALLVPEYVMKAAENESRDQRWRASGGMILRINPDPGQSHYKYTDYGSRSQRAKDAELHTSDILLMPTGNFKHNVLTNLYHLGGLTVWY